MKPTRFWFNNLMIAAFTSLAAQPLHLSLAFTPFVAQHIRVPPPTFQEQQYLLGHRLASGTASRCIHSCLWMTDSEQEKETNEEFDEVTAIVIDDKLSGLQKLRRRLFPPKVDDGLTFRQRMAKAGLSVALSYGWVSNVSYSITVSLAWYIFSKRTGLSPLAPGQWKSFLAVYAGFYVFNNIVRPVRFALSVSVSMYFENVVSMIQKKFKVKKGVAIGLTVFLANVVGTIALMCLGISIASSAAGVPVFPPKP